MQRTLQTGTCNCQGREEYVQAVHGCTCKHGRLSFLSSQARHGAQIESSVAKLAGRSVESRVLIWESTSRLRRACMRGGRHKIRALELASTRRRTTTSVRGRERVLEPTPTRKCQEDQPSATTPGSSSTRRPRRQSVQGGARGRRSCACMRTLERRGGNIEGMSTYRYSRS